MTLASCPRNDEERTDGWRADNMMILLLGVVVLLIAVLAYDGWNVGRSRSGRATDAPAAGGEERAGGRPPAASGRRSTAERSAPFAVSAEDRS